MASELAFTDVCRRVSEFGNLATLVTVSDAGTPHAVTVLVSVAGERLVATVGARTRLNLLARPSLSLLWMPADGGAYQLILDGTAETVGEAEDEGLTKISIAVTNGILHRLAGRNGAGPSCVALAAS